MSEPKGEWILSNTHNFSGTYVIWVECNDKRIFSIRENSNNTSLNQFEVNARRIVQCVNSHDDLLVACEQALVICKHTGGMPDTCKQLEREIAKAKK